MLCRKFGVDVKNFAIDRIPEELAGKSPKEIRTELSRTRSAMSEIASRVSEEIYRRRADRSKDQLDYYTTLLFILQALFQIFLHFLRKRQPLPYCAASNSCRISRHRAASGTIPVK